MITEIENPRSHKSMSDNFMDEIDWPKTTNVIEDFQFELLV